jgi:hypothetical protein
MTGPAWFTGITATGKDSSWAVGERSAATGDPATGGFAAAWNGKRWRTVALPVSPFVPVSVSSRGKSGIWILGYKPKLTNGYVTAEALVYTGRWHVLPLPAGLTLFWTYLGDLQSAVVTSSDVWVIGSSDAGAGSQFHSVLWNWNGHGWAGHPMPVYDADSANSVSAVPGAVWVTTLAIARSSAYQWTGGSWRKAKLPYVSEWPAWPGCDSTGTGELAPVPGTTATWFAGVCFGGRTDYSRPILGITGRL